MTAKKAQPKAKKKATAKKAAPKKAAKKAVPKKAAATRAATKKASPKKAATKKAAARKASPKKASPPKKAAAPGVGRIKVNKFFDKDFLTAQRALLLEERAQYTASADRLEAEAQQLAADREPGDVQFDEESGEGDTISVERDRDLKLSAKARENVQEIDEALDRLLAGTYGICESSGEPIPKERLEFIPHTRVRVEYKAARLGSW
ncbi:MAG: TraR/DksA family transcriptional regulator [Acidimicrobiales bacterium]